MLFKLREYFRVKFERWLANRLHCDNVQKLSNRNIYIFPSKLGTAYIGFVVLLFILGTNYQNNLILLFSYVLASFFVSVMLHTFFNLSGLKIAAEDEYRLFSKQDGDIKLRLWSDRAKYALSLSLGANENHLTDISRGNQVVHVNYVPSKRGIFNIERMNVFSRYAFGLFHCWSYLQFKSQIIAYPQPIEITQSQFDHLLSLAKQHQDALPQSPLQSSGYLQGEDFSELRRYQIGEPISQVAWKSVAKGQPWMSKHYESESSDKLMFSLNQISEPNIETKLGILCFVLLNLQRSNREYGLKLDNINVLPASSDEHLQRCLTLLAEYKG
ncbi:hypothetical protein [Thalassotalea fusca]